MASSQQDDNERTLPPPFQKPSLFMIDFQNDFCSPGGYADHAMPSSSSSLVWVRDIIPTAQALLQAARACAVLIVHTREGYAPDLSDCHALKLERSKAGGCEIGSAGPMGRFLIRGEPGHDIIPELYPLKSETVIDKAGYCAFRTTALLSILQKHDIREVIFAGVTADVCVHTTLRTAVEFGYRCYYCKDAISTMEPSVREACETMVTMEGGIWGHLVTVSVVQALLQEYQQKQQPTE